MLGAALLPLLVCLAPQSPAAIHVELRTRPVEGLGLQSGVGRLDPSDVLRIGGRHFVFYSKIRRTEPLFPNSLRGNIWYATSEDAGFNWTERGVALQRGKEGEFDARGVSDPTALLEPGGSVLLYYTGVGPTLNVRLEAGGVVHRTHLGVARLRFDEDGALMEARRLNEGDPVLEPLRRETRRFDSLRVEGPSVIEIDGRLHLYYRGRAYPEEYDRSALGLAVGSSPEGPFVRENDGWPVLPTAADSCILPFDDGVLVLQTMSPRMLWWSADGVHFGPTIARVEGRLNAPGLYRATEGYIEATDPDTERAIWGLHVARMAPEPYLERFEIDLPEELPHPPVTVIPAPSNEDRAAAAGWLGGGWLDQHLDIMRIAIERPKHCVFLGDSITQGWGGRGRNVTAPGAEAWRGHWEQRDFANYGVSGDRTQNVLWRLDHGELLRARNEVVVLAIGTNNIGRDTPDEIAAGVAAILDRLHRLVPGADVLLMGILPRGEEPDDDSRVQVDQTNERLARLDRLPTVTWVDLASSFLDEGGHLRRELYAPDLLHLSPAGYEAWACALDPLLARLLDSPSRLQAEPERAAGQEKDEDGAPADRAAGEELVPEGGAEQPLHRQRARREDGEQEHEL